MTNFIELTDSRDARKILLNLKEVTFIQTAEKNGTTIIHFTSSTYAADRVIEVTEDYESIKTLISKAGKF